MKIALAQCELRVGDLDYNRNTLLWYTKRAAEQGADIIAFPEMTLVGYPPEDLVFRKSFRDASVESLELIARGLKYGPDIAIIVGYVDHARDERGVISSDTTLATNSAAFIYKGEILARYSKMHLPTYGVFDEARYFVPGEEVPVVEFKGRKIAMTICEDAWQRGIPFAMAADNSADLIFSLNGSPYETGKSTTRRPLISQRASQTSAMVCYVNQVGGQDELVFDGDSFIVDSKGIEVANAGTFIDNLLVYDTEDAPMPAGAPRDYYGEMWEALVLGLESYVKKNGFKSVILGVSGGIDSAVCAALAADAIGGENVYGVRMPSPHSSQGSLDDAAELMQNIDGQLSTFAIDVPMLSYASLHLSGIAAENLQARLRGVTLMALSNKDGHLVLAPGNKSELAVGYSTIYGDAVGGYGPIKDVYKTDVFKLAEWRNSTVSPDSPIIPVNTITKPPSAELAPGQQDTDSLPPYEVLDAILKLYVEGDASMAQMVHAGFDKETVTRVVGLVDRAEWKRRQYPPGTKITLKNFGRDRRVPITSKWKESSD